MKKILRLVIIGALTVAIVKSSNFGFRIWSKSFVQPSNVNAELSERLKSHVYELSEKIGERSVFKYEQLNQARDYIVRQLESFGYGAEFQTYTVYGKESKNIIAVKRGRERPGEIIIVGAHYDSCSNPGADDNASGVAVLLELARLMNDEENSRTIKFIAFVNEEPPFFQSEEMGSKIYAKAAREKGENIKAAIILEMVGYYTDKANAQKYPPFFGFFYPNKGNFICVAGNFSSRQLVKKVVSGFKKHSQFPIESFTGPSFVPGLDFSDNRSFWQEGYPAVMITDTAFYRNPYYHSQEDTYEKLNYESMAEVIKGLRKILDLE